MDTKITYGDPEEPGKFITEDEDGTIREATSEEVEETVEQWQQWEKEGNENSKRN